MLPEPDRIRIRHMLEAAEQAASFVAGRARGDLETDPQLRLALVRTLEIVGEAAGRVSKATCEACPEVPWQPMVRMRNRLVHAYFDIDLDIVWTTATRSVPELLPLLRAALGEGDGE